MGVVLVDAAARLVELEKAFGEARSLVDLAIGKDGIECLLKEFEVALIVLERSPVIGRGCVRVTLSIGLARGEVVPCRGAACGVTLCLRLRRRLRGEHLRERPRGSGGNGQGSDRTIFHGTLLSSEELLWLAIPTAVSGYLSVNLSARMNALRTARKDIARSVGQLPPAP